MPEYLTPGVYIEEIEPGPRPIEGVPTSTSAFIGETERGPLRPTLLTSYTDYLRWFGGTFSLPGGDRYMPHAATGFFENGGKRLYGCRVVGDRATTATLQVGDFTVRAVGPGLWGTKVLVRIRESSTRDGNNNPVGFRLRFSYWSERPSAPYDPFDPANDSQQPRPQYQEEYDDLSVDPLSPDYYETRLLDATTGQATTVLAVIERTAGTNSLPEFNDAPVRLSRTGSTIRTRSIRPATSGFRSPPARCRVSRPWSSPRFATSPSCTPRGLRRMPSPSRPPSSLTASGCASALPSSIRIRARRCAISIRGPRRRPDGRRRSRQSMHHGS